MTQKTMPFFKPAPRPVSKTSPEDAMRLVEASADLGFNRPSHGKEANGNLPETAETQMPLVKPQALSTSSTVSSQASIPKPTKTLSASPKKPIQPAKVAVVYDQALKVDVSDELWVALKMETIKRRVSMKFLVLEALEKAGYPVDLNTVPEDGRRLRRSSVD